MLENKKKRSVLSFLIILNFILIIICLARIKFSYAKVEKYTNMASNKYQDKDFFYSNNIVNINYKGYDLTYEIIGITDNYDNLGKYLYIQTCNESANGDIILVAKKV